MTVTSATKGLAATVNTLLDSVRDGNFGDYAGQIKNLGLVSGDDMSLNYVGLADSTIWTEGFTEDDYKALVKGMFDGSIQVSNDSTAPEPTADSLKINFQGNLK